MCEVFINLNWICIQMKLILWRINLVGCGKLICMIKVDLTENFGIKLSISGKKVVVLKLKLTVLTTVF